MKSKVYLITYGMPNQDKSYGIVAGESLDRIHDTLPQIPRGPWTSTFQIAADVRDFDEPRVIRQFDGGPAP